MRLPPSLGGVSDRATSLNVRVSVLRSPAQFCLFRIAVLVNEEGSVSEIISPRHAYIVLKVGPWP